MSVANKIMGGRRRGTRTHRQMWSFQAGDCTHMCWEGGTPRSVWTEAPCLDPPRSHPMYLFLWLLNSILYNVLYNKLGRKRVGEQGGSCKAPLAWGSYHSICTVALLRPEWV